MNTDRWRVGIPLALILSGLLLTSCGESRRILRISIVSTPENLDPFYSLHVEEFRIAVHLYESLLKLDPAGNPVPNIAREWEYDDTLTELTVRLRTDIHFHDGTLLKADNVAESLSRIAFPDESVVAQMAVSPEIIGNPDAIEVVDDSTLVIRLPAPHTPLLRTLATPAITPIGGSSCYRIRGIEIPVGTGPYLLRSFRPHKGLVVLRRFEKYWASPPEADLLRFIHIPSSDEAVEKILEGRLDLHLTLSIGSVQSVILAGEAELGLGSGNAYMVIGLNNSRPPFDKLEARRALARSIDVAELAEDLWKSAAHTTDRYIVPKLIPEVTSPPAPAFEPGLAERYFTEHLNDDERTIVLLLGSHVSAEKRSRIHGLLRNQLGKVGLDLDLAFESDWGAYESRLSEGNWDLVLDGLSIDNRDLFTFLYFLYARERESGTRGLFAIRDQGFIDHLEEARTSRNETASLEAYQESVNSLAALIPCVPLVELVTFFARSTKVDEFTPGPYPDWNLANVRKGKWR